MGRNDAAGGWAIGLWSLQLVPVAALDGIFGSLIRVTGFSELSAPMRVIGVLGFAWTVVVVAMLATSRGRRAIVRHRAEWGLVLGATAVTLVAGDVAFNWIGVVPSLEERRARSLDYTFYPFSGYRMIPKSVTVDAGPGLSINSRGFRGPEIDADRPASRRRIVFLGGSQVFDFRGANWPEVTGELLRQRGYDVDIVNAGVPGNTSTDSLLKLVTDVWTLRPDVVAVCHGWNDVKYFARMSGGVPYRGLPPPEPVTMHRDWRLYPTGIDRLLSRSAIYRYLRSDLIDLYISAEGRDLWEFDRARPAVRAFDDFGPRQFELNLRAIEHFARRIGAVAVFCKQAVLEQGVSATGVDVAQYAQRNIPLAPPERARAFAASRHIVAALGADTGAVVFDLHAAMAGRSELFLDGVHFTEAGSRAAARHTADALEAVLGPPPASASRPVR